MKSGSRAGINHPSYPANERELSAPILPAPISQVRKAVYPGPILGLAARSGFYISESLPLLVPTCNNTDAFPQTILS